MLYRSESGRVLHALAGARLLPRAVLSRGFAGLLAVLLWAVAPVAAGTDDERTGGDPLEGLRDVIVEAIEEALEMLFEPVSDVIEAHGDQLVQIVVGTPSPDSLFGKPSNPPWPGLYEFYWQQLLPAVVFLFGVMVGVVIFLETTSHLFSSYHRSKLHRRALSGLLGILSWWWMATLALRLVDAVTTYLVPDLSQVTLFQTLSFAGMGVLGLVVGSFINLGLFLLIGLVYFARLMLLYVFVVLMPLLIVFWVPGVGPFKPVARLMERLAGFFVPLAFMTVPVAMMLRVAHVLGTRGGSGVDGIVAWLSALALPFLALLVPVVLFWQAGALFLVASRAGRNVSRSRAGKRLTRAKELGGQARSQGRTALARVGNAAEAEMQRIDGLADESSQSDGRPPDALGGNGASAADAPTSFAGASADASTDSSGSSETFTTLKEELGGDSGPSDDGGSRSDRGVPDVTFGDPSPDPADGGDAPGAASTGPGERSSRTDDERLDSNVDVDQPPHGDDGTGPVRANDSAPDDGSDGGGDSGA